LLERAGNPAPRPILDVHDVKERGATGTVSQTQAKPVPRACANAPRPKALAWFSDALRVVLRAICPSCLFGGGEKPCAGYSGFGIEPCSAQPLVLEDPRYDTQTPTNRRSLGRLDRAVAALSAAAICDAMRIGFLSVSAEISVGSRIKSAGECLIPRE
jgi:hypothetical protein